MGITDFDNTGHGASDDAPSASPQMTLATGELGANSSLDPLAGATRTKKLNGGLLLIIVVMIIAAGGLFFMRKLAAVTASMVIDRDVERTIETFIESNREDEVASSGRLTADYDEVLGVLTEAYSERQVPWRDVQRDPFIIFQPPIDSPVLTETDNPSMLQEQIFLQRQAERRAQFQKGVDKLHLKSILGGSNPLAIVNGKIVRVGDLVVVNEGSQELRYRIKNINGASVDLAGEAPEFALTIPFSLRIHE